MGDVFEDFSDRLPDLPFWFKQVLSGPHENFHYLIGDPDTMEAAVVDPAFHLDELFAMAEADGYQVTTAIFTHGHWDHIGGIPAIFDLGVERVIIHEAAAEHAKVAEARARVRLVAEGETFEIGALPVTALHTPGHQPESTCFLAGRARGAQALFGGDTIFINSCGRTDFSGGEPAAMHSSMRRLATLSAPDVFVMPGHHYSDRPWASLADQCNSNPALATADYEQFKLLPFLSG